MILGHAIALIADAFKDKKDIGGAPYFFHCFRVATRLMQQGAPLPVVIAGLGHDLLEDCPGWIPGRLVEAGFDRRSIELMILLYHDPSETYLAYLLRLAEDNDAIWIKLEDLNDNMDITRLKDYQKLPEAKKEAYLNGTLPVEDFLRESAVRRLNKYKASYKALSAILNSKSDAKRQFAIGEMSRCEIIKNNDTSPAASAPTP